VPETDAVEKTIESMINLDGAALLFPTSFGYYNPHVIKMANKFPRVAAVAMEIGGYRASATSGFLEPNFLRALPQHGLAKCRQILQA
jgi:hypothetical protein